MNNKSTIKSIKVDSALWGKKINMDTYVGGGGTSTALYVYVRFYNASGTEISQILCKEIVTRKNVLLDVPANTDKISFQSPSSISDTNTYCIRIYEIGPANVPVINGKQYYPRITKYGVEKQYGEVEINYFNTSVQKLYKIGNSDWQVYKGNKIRLEIGETIYAKGIDKYGTETNLASYTSVSQADALGMNAYDSNINTLEELKRRK